VKGRLILLLRTTAPLGVSTVYRRVKRVTGIRETEGAGLPSRPGCAGFRVSGDSRSLSPGHLRRFCERTGVRFRGIADDFPDFRILRNAREVLG